MEEQAQYGSHAGQIAPNELRIGNTVSTSPQCGFFDIMTLSQKDFEHLIVFNTWHRIYPIPLSESWLERLGFQEGSVMPNGDREYYMQGKLSLYFWWTNGVLEFEYNEGYEPETRELKYLHELQNLIHALTGTELEVKQAARQ